MYTEVEAAAHHVYVEEQKAHLRDYHRENALRSVKMAYRVLDEVLHPLKEPSISEEELHEIETRLGQLLGFETQKNEELEISRKLRKVYPIVKSATDDDEGALFKAAAAIGYKPPKQAIERALNARKRGPWAAALDLVAATYDGKTGSWLDKQVSRKVALRSFADGMDQVPIIRHSDRNSSKK